MRKTSDIFFILLIFFVIYFLQSNFFTWFNIAGVMPNLFIILIMLVGLFMKKKLGFIFGIIFGILIDIFIGARIGINAISLAIVGLAIEYFDKNFSKDNRLTVMFITAISTLIFEVIFYILQIVFCNVEIQILEFIKIIFIETIYNTILMAIIYPVFLAFGSKIENDFINNSSFLKY